MPEALLMDANRLATLKKKIQQQDASKNGSEEHAAKNNHGTWFYAQSIDFALVTGNTAKAKELIEEAIKKNGFADQQGRKNATGARPHQWSYQQISEYKKNNIYMLLLQAAAVYKDPTYTALAKQLDEEVNDVVTDMLYK